LSNVCELALDMAFILPVRGTHGLGVYVVHDETTRDWRMLDKVVGRR
jgi:hypothetical protein